jgi:predicted Zn-dependent peptidase
LGVHSESFESIPMGEGMQLHICSTNKFKTIVIQVHLAIPLERNTVTMGALLPNVLKRGSKDYSSELKLRQKLDDLYGATLEVDTMKKGENLVMAFRMEIALERFLRNSTDLFAEAVRLLSSILLHPNKQQDGFSENVLTIEKENLQKRIDAMIDDKMRYANIRTAEEMCAGEPYALTTLGYKEDLAGITPEKLYSFYQQVIEGAFIDLYVVGEVEADAVKDRCALLFPPRTQATLFKRKPPVDRQVEQTRTVVEQLEVSQGKLHLGFRTHIRYQDEDYFPLLLFNGVYGGFPNSRLFIHVREKESLAYYSVSRLESLKGLMIVMSGIEVSNYEKAKEIILKQWEDIKAGNITDRELEQTKAMIVNQMKELSDTPYSMIDYHYNSLLGNRMLSILEYIEMVQGVRKDQVIDASRKIELDLIYFLRNREVESA